MPRKKKQESDDDYFNDRKFSEAKTEEARENQMIALSLDLVEHRLRNGTASSQETTHFLKLGSMKARLELEVLEKQKDLLEAKTENINSSKTTEELYRNALDAMRTYSGSGGPTEDV